MAEIGCPTCGGTFASRKQQREHALATGHAAALTPRLAVMMAKDPRCTWCGGTVLAAAPPEHPLGPTREHLVTRSSGGGRGRNLVLAHRLCNSMRATMSEAGFRKLMGGEAVTREELWPGVEFPRPSGRRRRRRRKVV